MTDATSDLRGRLRDDYEPTARCRVTGAPFRPIKDTATLNRERREAADLIDRLTAESGRMREAITAAIDCGMVPKSSASEGGAMRHSRQVQVADMLRAALGCGEDTRP